MVASLVPTEGGNPIVLDKPIILIGRNQDCDIALQNSSKVSRRHCCIVQCGERYLVRDLGSMNGVRVNSTRVIEAELKAGDEVAVADVDFTFRVDEVVDRPAPRVQKQPREPDTPAAEMRAVALPADDRDLLPLPAPADSADIIPCVDPHAKPLESDPELPAEGDRRLSDSQSQAGFVRV